MNIPKKYRSWLLGGALLLTVAATAAVNSKDDEDIGVVRRDAAKSKELAAPQTISRESSQEKEHLAVSEAPTDSLVNKLRRSEMPETVKNMFPSKSWYVPPPPPKVIDAPAPPPVPTAPPLEYRFIGKMLEEGNHSAVFLENKSRIFVVREGDTIESKYRVDSIDPPLLTLTYLPLDIKQTMQIGEVN